MNPFSNLKVFQKAQNDLATNDINQLKLLDIKAKLMRRILYFSAVLSIPSWTEHKQTYECPWNDQKPVIKTSKMLYK